MSKISRFEEMEVWKLARAFTVRIYSVSGSALFRRDFALRDQIRRASVSIVSNIAEGFESQSNSTFCRFLGVARASTAEVRAQLYLALDLGYISPSDFSELLSYAESIGGQLTGFIKYRQTQSRKF